MKRPIQQYISRDQSVFRRVAQTVRVSETQMPVKTKRKPTGLPDNLKPGIETFRVIRWMMVHYNLAKPPTQTPQPDSRQS